VMAKSRFHGDRSNENKLSRGYRQRDWRFPERF
jgi:hypothetical protein